MANPLKELGQVPHDQDNEAVILTNAIRNSEHREKFSRQVDYREFRLPEFVTLAYAIQVIHNEKLDMNIDMLLLKSATCPVRKYLSFEFIEQLLNNFDGNISDINEPVYRIAKELF